MKKNPGRKERRKAMSKGNGKEKMRKNERVQKINAGLLPPHIKVFGATIKVREGE